MINKKPEQGIVIVATGHPYYGRLAYNLALTIKAAQDDCAVCVIHSERSLAHLSEKQKTIFDFMVYVANIPNDCNGKLYAYRHSPFKKTLLLDADTVWLPKNKPSALFQQLNGIAFTGITEGHDTDPSPKYYFWAEPDEIRKQYQCGRIYQWRSEVLYFEKCATAYKLFRDAISISKNPRVPVVKHYAGMIPDELSINIAAAINGIEPHQYKWQPSYWYLLNGGLIPSVVGISANYWVASFGGNMTNPNAKKFYDSMVKVACYQLGVQHVFPLHSKNEFLPERRKV